MTRTKHGEQEEQRHAALVAPDRLVVEIDGPGASPETIDSASALAVAAAYLDLLTEAAQHAQQRLTFAGLEVVDKCVAILLRPSDPLLAQMFSASSVGWVAGATLVPRGLHGSVERVRDSLVQLPRECYAAIAVGDWRRLLVYEESGEADAPTALTTLRAQVVRVGGRKPRARFTSASEASDFTLTTSIELALGLARHLYSDVTIEARIKRRASSEITGTLLGFAPLDGRDPRSAWREWFKPQQEGWRDVEDVEGDLGRSHDD